MNISEFEKHGTLLPFILYLVCVWRLGSVGTWGCCYYTLCLC